MFTKLAVVLSCIVIGVCFANSKNASSARLVREVPSNPELPSFSNFFETAGKNLKELENIILKSLGVENTQQLEHKVLNEGKQIATKLDDWAKDIKKETESLKENPAIKDLRASVDKAIDEFKLKNSDTTSDVRKYVEKAKEDSEAIITKMKALAESEEAKNIKELSQKLLDSAATTFKNISTQIQQDKQ